MAGRYVAGGHSVPIEKIVSRYSKSIVNCAGAMKFVDRVYVYDNSVDFQPARLLFRTSEGKLAKSYGHNIPQWARILLKAVE